MLVMRSERKTVMKNSLTPPRAAADKPPSHQPGEPFKGEVSRTDSPGAGISAAPPGQPADHEAPKPANPTAAQTATTSEYSSLLQAATAPEDETDELRR
jgi:hypothetical protein